MVNPGPSAARVGPIEGAEETVVRKRDLGNSVKRPDPYRSSTSLTMAS